MAITASVFIATSLDGYIARADGAIDWLMAANAAVPPGEDCGYAAFMQTVDVLVMGRHTYEQVAQFEPWPYEGKRVVVMASQALNLRAGPGIRLEASAEAPRPLLRRLAEQGCQRAYVDGGQVIQSFLKEGLIDDLTITTIPVVLGSGRRLFGSVPSDVWLEWVSTLSHPWGFVQSHYRVRRDRL